MSDGSRKRGTLFLVVGPSGAGKDTLLAGVRQALARDPRYYFPRRLITRPRDDGLEMHVPVSPRQFAKLSAEGGFALAWEAHGLQYAIPAQVEGALERGLHVVANASRAAVEEARSRFAPLAVLQITASEADLARRIAARGREGAEDATKRLTRAAALRLDGPDVTTIVNDDTVEAGVAAFLTALGLPAPARAAAGGD